MSEETAICAACQVEPCNCIFPAQEPGAQPERRAMFDEKFGADETIRRQAKRIAELEYAVTNLHATQMEEVVRIGLARDSERDEAAKTIGLLKNRIDYQEQDLLKNMGEIAILREAAGSDKEELSTKIAKLEDQIVELQTEPWPQWAETILKKLEEFGCYDRSVDDEVDLGELFLEWLEGLEEAEEREDISLQNFRLSLRNDINDMATQSSKINQWAVDRQKRPNSDYLEVATRMLEINRKMRADIRREESRRRTYYKPPED